MKTTFVGRKIEVSDRIKNAVDKQLSKLDKFFGDDADARITVSEGKGKITVEATIYHKGMIYRAEETNTDAMFAIDRISDLIERQIRKNKTRLEKRLRETAFVKQDTEAFEEEKEFKIIKSKRHSVKPMSAEEAILQMNLLGHEFYIFKSDTDNLTSVAYKRKDGNYGIIEAEEE